MRRIANSLNLMLVVALLCLGSTGVRAESPPPPATCPAKGTGPDSTLVNAVCSNESLMQLAAAVQHQYFYASVGPHEEPRKLRYRWQSEHWTCASLVMQRDRMDACIGEALERFSASLLPLAPAQIRTPRNETFRQAFEAIEEYLLIARQARAECIRTYATVVDDGISSARDIAVVVAKGCKRESARLALLTVVKDELEQPFVTVFLRSHETISTLTSSLSEPDELIADILSVRRDKRDQARTPARDGQPTKSR